METTWIEIGGVSIRSPVTAGTNFLLAVQCLVYFVVRRSRRSPRARGWGGFFALMSLATFAGVLKHGARHLLSELALITVLAVSNVASGAATYLAQEATIAAHAPQRLQARLRLLVDVQLALFLAVNVIFGPEILFLIVNTAVGLLPIIAVEARRHDVIEGGGLVAGGLALSLLTGLVYLVELSAGPWMNHIDIAHVVMGVSFLTIHRGLLRSGGGSWS